MTSRTISKSLSMQTTHIPNLQAVTSAKRSPTRPIGGAWDLVDQVPHGCRITIISDSRHSGGLIDEAKEQIGESYKNDPVEQEGSGLGFNLSSFLHKTAESVLESQGIRIHRKSLAEEEETEATYEGDDDVKSNCCLFQPNRNPTTGPYVQD
ncbi:hypothetical protein L1887_22797 [Cichorium endivia]|nr:hypothetical protein L1887_22797 [Cichorium endivia]